MRGPHVKDRYDGLWATDRAAGRDPGWHRTGDVGHLDGEGRLWIEGRLAHVITTADGPVAPIGPEQRIERLDAVSAAAVVGVGPEGAQVVVAVVVPGTPARPRPLRARRAVRRLGAAPAELADEVRAAAGLAVAAVLVTDTLCRSTSVTSPRWTERNWPAGPPGFSPARRSGGGPGAVLRHESPGHGRERDARPGHDPAPAGQGGRRHGPPAPPLGVALRGGARGRRRPLRGGTGGRAAGRRRPSRREGRRHRQVGGVRAGQHPGDEERPRRLRRRGRRAARARVVPLGLARRGPVVRGGSRPRRPGAGAWSLLAVQGGGRAGGARRGLGEARGPRRAPASGVGARRRATRGTDRRAGQERPSSAHRLGHGAHRHHVRRQRRCRPRGSGRRVRARARGGTGGLQR